MYMGIKKRRILMKSYIFSQFNYCSLVWMCHSRSLNYKINRIQERALQIRDYKSSFKELLQKDKSITIHQKNRQYLAIEIYKVKMDISPKIMNEIFWFSRNFAYSLRSGIELEKPSINTVQFRVYLEWIYSLSRSKRLGIGSWKRKIFWISRQF